ncbi:hypothetical protein [Clostridium butyricum]|uniref:Uncharacterized protein n=1 Tax=Clostridium butyricum TaxID=1492 RepID=A0AAP9UF76_CLOBU|nr:hypothetical protein [Clostridium butyricum]DAL93471.1 MAG TPA: hypothetical protein [Caudoviricetes sp.]ALS16914.1 hypothetical protein ATD26_08560 [Clostridium butyricum]MBZ5748101.1 hypothetical protein [Clostridium butyricum]MDI9209184.1 hypothetical protein [Clostridium butyricum]QMW90974.1 hypothetical protein FF104_08355 [Clostridium butyricum]
MKAKVLKTFVDGVSKKIRIEGEVFDLSVERFASISSINDKLIKEIDNVIEYPNHIGGGYYELSNGEKVKGKDEALKAEEALKETAGDPPNNENE